MSTKHPDDRDSHLDDYVATFATQLRAVPTHPRTPTPRPFARRRPLMLALSGVLAGLIMTAGALVGGGSTGKRLNVLSEARAALNPAGVLHMKINEGFNDSGPGARTPGLFGLTGGADPAADLQRALTLGDLIDEGEQQVNGRTVRRLVGKPSPNDGKRVTRRFVYDVDPDTFAPVGGEMQIGYPTTQGNPITTRFHVDEYDRLPATTENERLLKIATGPATKTTTNSAEKLREQERDLFKDCVSVGEVMRCPGP